MQQNNEYIRNNTNLKAPNVTEYIDQQTFNFRLEQIKKIREDVQYFAEHYFYIISLDEGKKIIKLYPKQAQLIKGMVNKKRLICLSARQAGKSTSYSVYALWFCLVNIDKNILICANKLKTAVEILSRIKMAYQLLPSWLKPGIITWNRTSVEFSNGCKISAEATSESSGRGTSINCISGDSIVTINNNNHIYNISLEDLYIIQDPSSMKILTDQGFSKFDSVIIKGYKNCIEINYHNNKLICTPDHKIFDQENNCWKQAKYFKHINVDDHVVYDIVNVQKNNKFIANNLIVHNCLILDEFAFLSPGLEEGFMASVYPVVSSSKTSQIIIVSTPNGMNNEYYRTWNKAKLNTNENVGWYPIQINWWDVPGRDQNWKAQQLATFNNDESRFLQQYGNSFLGSVTTLINGQIIQKYKKQFDSNNITKPHIIQLHKDYPSTKVNIYLPPQKNRAYILGADPSTGSDNDYQALTIWDITDTFKIKMVASFYENDIPPKIFAYIICKLATIYNHAYVAMENNGVSFATLDYLFRQFQYQNIIHLGGNPKTSIGIASGGERKFEACVNFKQFLEHPLRKIQIFDGRLIQEMERFERHNRSGKTPTYYATSGHDDFIMCSIWAFYILKPELLQNYYNINNFIQDKFGKQIPLFITSTENASNDDLQYINSLDQQFKNNNYQTSVNQLQQNISINPQQIKNSFQKFNSISSSNQQQNNNDKFQFSGFFS